MFFLMRSAFWLFLVFAFLPINRPADEAGIPVSAHTAISAAQSTITDLAGFCDRNPDACEAGRLTAKALGERAQTGAVAVYHFVTEKGDQIVARPDTNTLSDADLSPTWKEPDTPKKGG